MFMLLNHMFSQIGLLLKCVSHAAQLYALYEAFTYVFLSWAYFIIYSNTKRMLLNQMISQFGLGTTMFFTQSTSVCFLLNGVFTLFWENMLSQQAQLEKTYVKVQLHFLLQPNKEIQFEYIFFNSSSKNFMCNVKQGISIDIGLRTFIPNLWQITKYVFFAVLVNPIPCHTSFATNITVK